MATRKKKGRNRGKGKGNGAQAPDVEQAARDVGARLLSGFKDELNIIKNPGNPKQSVWGCLSEIQQDELLDRFGRRIEDALVRGYQAILANGFPAVHANLAKVSFGGKAIQGQLEIPLGSSHRHALADFANQDVLVVLTEDLDEYLASMKNVKPDKDQKDLPLAGEGSEPEATGDEAALDDDPRTLMELRIAAVEAGLDLAEDITDDTVAGWSREHCLDYIAWAQPDGPALPTDHPAGPLPEGHPAESS